MKPLISLLALGLPFGETVDRVKAVLSEAGIACKATRAVLDCPRPPAEVAGAAGLRLEFAKDGLTRAVLNVDPGSRTYAAFHSRYLELKRDLIARYGEPGTSLEYVDRFYVLADEEYKAIAEGKGEFTSTWKTGELAIRLSLYGERGKVRLAMEFQKMPGKDKG